MVPARCSPGAHWVLARCCEVSWARCLVPDFSSPEPRTSQPCTQRCPQSCLSQWVPNCPEHTCLLPIASSPSPPPPRQVRAYVRLSFHLRLPADPLSLHLEPLRVDVPPACPWSSRASPPGGPLAPRVESPPHTRPLQGPPSLRDPHGPHSQAPGQGSPCACSHPCPGCPPSLQSQHPHLEVLTPSPPGCPDPQSGSLRLG